MNDLIAYRLEVEEQLPEGLEFTAIREADPLIPEAAQLKVFFTDDGKLYLQSPGMFDLVVTVGTIDPRRQWLLADLNFLYLTKQNIKSAHREFSMLGIERRQSHRIYCESKCNLLFCPTQLVL